jgi:hypothetical protein
VLTALRFQMAVVTVMAVVAMVAMVATTVEVGALQVGLDELHFHSA